MIYIPHSVVQKALKLVPVLLPYKGQFLFSQNFLFLSFYSSLNTNSLNLGNVKSKCPYSGDVITPFFMSRFLYTLKLFEAIFIVFLIASTLLSCVFAIAMRIPVRLCVIYTQIPIRLCMIYTQIPIRL